MSAERNLGGRPVEPNSIRSEAKRRGVTMWRVRQDRASRTEPGYDPSRVQKRKEPPIEDGSTPDITKPEVSRKPTTGG